MTDFHTTSGFAAVCTHCGTHRRLAPVPATRPHGNGRIRSAALAISIGTALAAVLFIGLSGGFRP